MKKNKLYYRGRSVNLETFKVGRKDLRRLIGFCCDCGCCLRGRAAVPNPDPYQADVCNDNTPVVQCSYCASEAAAEI